MMILLDKNRIERTLKRMAYQILEETKGHPITLVGLNVRGYAVALRLKKHLDAIQNTDVPLFKVKAESDTSVQFSENLNENNVLVLIDDVIFSGGTMFNTIRKIPDLSVFNKILLTVLVDRGHRKYPLLAGVVGVHAPTKLNEHVELTLENNEPENLILIQNNI